jgi:hypothetical protein
VRFFCFLLCVAQLQATSFSAFAFLLPVFSVQAQFRLVSHMRFPKYDSTTATGSNSNSLWRNKGTRHSCSETALHDRSHVSPAAEDALDTDSTDNKPQRTALLASALITAALILWAAGASPSFLPAFFVITLISSTVLCLMMGIGRGAGLDEHPEPIVWQVRAHSPHRNRVVLEVMLVVGWVLGTVRWLVFDVHVPGFEEEERERLAWLHLFFFPFSTLPLAALFLNHNTDKAVRSFLLKDFQYKLACALTVWIIAVHCWSLFVMVDLTGERVTPLRRLSMVLESGFVWSPLLGILTVDMLKVQSPFFRRAAPPVFVLFLVTASVVARYYDRASTVLFNITKGSAGAGRPVTSTGEGQVGQAAGSLLFLLTPQLVAMARDAHNLYVCFPMQLRMTRELAAVAVLLESGSMEVTPGGLVRQLRDNVFELTTHVGVLEQEEEERREREGEGEAAVAVVNEGDENGREVSLLSSSERDAARQEEEEEEADGDGVVQQQQQQQQHQQQQHKPWRGAAGLGIVGGLVGAWGSAQFLSYSKLGPPFYGDGIQITAFLIVFVLFGAVGLYCLPSKKGLPRTARVVFEVLVVAGWAGGVYSRVLFTVFYGESWYRTGTVANALGRIGNLLFFLSPLSFTALCWNNMDTAVLRLLARQTQFWTVALLVAGIIIVNMWGRPASTWEDHRPLLVIAFAILCYSPYFIVLFLDGILVQSPAFRFALPVLYLSYAAITIILCGYTRNAANRPVTLVNMSGSFFTRHEPVVLTDLGLMTSMNSTILFLMAGYLYGRISGNGCFCCGGSGGGSDQGSSRSTASDAQALQPICFPVTVRLLRADVGDVAVVRGKVDLSSVMDEIRQLSGQVAQLEGRKSKHTTRPSFGT